MDFKKMVASFSIFALLYSSAPFAAVVAKSDSDNSGPSRKIVVYQDNVSDVARDNALGRLNAKRIKRLQNALNADVIDGLTMAEAEELASNPDVKRIDDDAMVEVQAREVVAGKGGDTFSQAAQVVPWGVAKIGANLVWPSGNSANPIKVAIVDTGISTGHPDLAANLKGGVNTINPQKSYNDDNGHGSHVAGIVAALNNSVGVVGVGPQVDLYAVKVLGRSGSGWISDIIEGIDWAIANNMQVVNMSLGSTSDVQSLHDAVIRAGNAGLVVVAAAGNSGGAVIFPAAYPEVVAVSATDQNDQIASWSSRGPEVDLAAPGVSIFSTYKGSNYTTLSGTSMATPHVAGAAALILNASVGSYDENGNGRWDANEVVARMKASADDLGEVGFDNLYGWGRVNAFQAVQ